jgi:hypothetical protein
MCEIAISTFESDYLGVKIGRASVSETTDFLLIPEVAKKENFNIVRVESPHLTSLPGYTYIRSINDYRHTYHSGIHPVDLHVEKIDTVEQADFFEQAIRENYLVDSLGYIKSPIVQQRFPSITALREAKCYAAYFRNFFTPSNDTKGALLFYKQKDCVGGYSYEVIGEGVHTSVALVLNPFRKSGYFKQYHDYRENLFFKAGVKFGYHGGRVNNIDVNDFYRRERHELIGSRHIYVLAL